MRGAGKLSPMGVAVGRAVPVGGCRLRIRCRCGTTRHRSERKCAQRKTGGNDG
jgi:hypothetical protein